MSTAHKIDPRPRLTQFGRKALAVANTLGLRGPDFGAANAWCVKKYGKGFALAPNAEYGSELVADEADEGLYAVWRGESLAGRALNAVDLPMRKRIVSPDARATAGRVSTGGAINLGAWTGTDVTTEPFKLGAGLMTSNEQMKQPGVEKHYARLLKQGLVLGADREFMAAMVDGVTALTYGATGSDEIRFIVREAIESIVDPDLDSLFIPLHPLTALALGQQTDSGTPIFPNVGIRGGDILGIPVFTSAGVTRATFTVVDGASVARSIADRPVLSASTAATVEMRTTTTHSVDIPSTMASLFQLESVALLVSQQMAFARMRAGSVAWVSGFTPELNVVTA